MITAIAFYHNGDKYQLRYLNNGLLYKTKFYTLAQWKRKVKQWIVQAGRETSKILLDNGNTLGLSLEVKRTFCVYLIPELITHCRDIRGEE